ncbi:MAG: hypothetical protein EA355_03740 [Rhodobacteraceae bacterium]|nr:MAG: hypothetical protein EA355_03740 [Paracoccaceae bacterium]
MSPESFQHVVMTRFNLATPGRESAIRIRPGWLSGRFDLFERYCLPSMAAQTRQDFDWIVYFDVDTPASFRERIERCREVRPFTPYYTPLFLSEGWPRSIRETFGETAPRLLTTRLDNDDALARDHVERLQAAVAPFDGARASFNFTNGFLLNGGRVYAHRHPANAFASQLEPWGAETRTASSIPHLDMADYGPVIQIPGPGGWLQVIHDGNVSNRTAGRRVAPDAAQDRFPAEVLGDLAPFGPIEAMLDRFVEGPARAARAGATRIAKRILRRPSRL